MLSQPPALHGEPDDEVDPFAQQPCEEVVPGERAVKDQDIAGSRAGEDIRQQGRVVLLVRGDDDIEGKSGKDVVEGDEMGRWVVRAALRTEVREKRLAPLKRQARAVSSKKSPTLPAEPIAVGDVERIADPVENGADGGRGEFRARLAVRGSGDGRGARKRNALDSRVLPKAFEDPLISAASGVRGLKEEKREEDLRSEYATARKVPWRGAESGGIHP